MGKKLLIGLGVVFLLVLIGVGAWMATQQSSQTSAQDPLGQVTYLNIPAGFSPTTLQLGIYEEGLVVFVNASGKDIDIEGVGTNSGKLNLGRLKTGPKNAKTIKFSEPGLYQYRNKGNAQQVGTIEIIEITRVSSGSGK